MRAAVPDQIKFDVAAPAVELEVALHVPEVGGFAAFYQRQIGIEKRIGNSLRHGKAAFETEFLKIVEKDTPYAALLAPVFKEKVLVAPGLETRVFVFAEWFQRALADAMKMLGVFFKAVIRREVHAATEPARRRARRWCGHQHAHIHVDRRHIGIVRVEHQRNTHGFKRRTSKFGAMLACRGRQTRAPHMRKTTTRAFKNKALLQNLRDAAALQCLARLFDPVVGDERIAVHRGHRCGDALLQIKEKMAASRDIYHMLGSVIGW